MLQLTTQAEDKSFAEELTEMANFSADNTDDQKMTVYSLYPVPSALQRELEAFILHRTATFAARRQGGAVVSASAEGDKQGLLRFFGYLSHLDRVPEGAALELSLLARADLGDLVQAYAGWLQNTQELRFSSIANYINSLVAQAASAHRMHAMLLQLERERGTVFDLVLKVRSDLAFPVPIHPYCFWRDDAVYAKHDWLWLMPRSFAVAVLHEEAINAP